MSKLVEELYEDTFDDTIASRPLVFVDFYADWCGPCKAIAPVIERVAKEYVGRVAFARVNTDGNPTIAAAHGIRSVPTLILFQDGSPASRSGGYHPEPALRSILDRFAPPPPSEDAAIPKPGLFARLLGRA